MTQKSVNEVPADGMQLLFGLASAVVSMLLLVAVVMALIWWRRRHAG